MQLTLSSVFVGALCVGVALYLIWLVAERLDSMWRRREARLREEAGEMSICRYGVDASGEIYRVRVRLPKRD